MAAKVKSATTAVKAALLSKSGQKVSSPSSSSQIEAAANLNDNRWREKYAKYKHELTKGVWGYWEHGLWKPLAISARHRAKLRREVLLAGEWAISSSSSEFSFYVTRGFGLGFSLLLLLFREWNHDPPRKAMRDVRKGHICDRISAQKYALHLPLPPRRCISQFVTLY